MIVYKATSRTSGKSYVGITSKTIAVRWSNHLCRARKGWPGKLYCAIRKYGSEDFDVSAVAKAETWDELLAMEVKFIAVLDTFKSGYNSTLGGEGSLGWVPSQDWRSKLSVINCGKVVSDVTRKKISESTSGKNNPRYGAILTGSTRDKISKWMLANSPARGVQKSAETRSRMSRSGARRRRETGTKYTHDGRSMILKDWSSTRGINRHTLAQRLKNGWSFEKAITIKVDTRRSRNKLQPA